MKKRETKPIIYIKDDRKFDYTRADRMNFDKVQTCSYVEKVTGDLKDFRVIISHYQLNVRKPKDDKDSGICWFYKGTESVHYDGKFHDKLDAQFCNIMIQAFNIDWIKTPWCRSLIRTDRNLWAMVIKGTITNPEQLAKKYSRMYFGGKYSYRILKRYFEGGCGISLWEIRDYTSNPELFLERYLNASDQQLLWDIIHCAKLEGTEINSLWSENRMKEEHTAQIRRANLAKIESMNPKPIAKEPFKSEHEFILDERTCFIEGLKMDNCIHRCYWYRVVKGDYILVMGDINGEHYNLGIRMYNGIPELDQVYKKRNKCVLPSTEEYCKSWINHYSEELVEHINKIKASKPVAAVINNNDEYPF